MTDSARPEIVIIAAVAASNRVIGRGLELPWHVPEDLKRFKRLTLGHPMLMGRRTMDSLVAQFGGPLPGRRSLVVTRSRSYRAPEGVETFHRITDAVAAAEGAERLFIAGGASIYAYFLRRADRLELTLVEGRHEGDVFFPAFEHLVGTEYEVTVEEPHDGFRFVTYRRITTA